MTAVTASHDRARSRAFPLSEGLFLATLFCVTFEKLTWSVGGNITISDVLAGLWVLTFAVGRIERGDRRFDRRALAVGGFLVLILLVWLVGFFNLDSPDAVQQFAKGIGKSVIHLLLLFCGVSYLARRSQAFFWKAFGVFVAGMVFEGLYGVLQLLAARSGFNLDSLVVSRLTGGASQINLYGIVQGASVYRINALTADPNHLAIMLLVPLLVLTPLYLRLEPEHPWRRRVGLTVAFLLLVMVGTLSRSGALGILAGLLVLLIPYRRRLTSRAVLVPLGVVVALLAVLFVARYHYFKTILETRVQTQGSSSHFSVYGFVPDVLHMHPLFGLGLNNFSVYYAQVTGKTNWGPHSFFVATIVETGIVGAIVLFSFFLYAFRRLAVTRRLGRELVAEGDPLGRRVSPLAWGLTAALVATLAANVFYLSMSFYYFYVLLMFVFAAPIVFGRGRPHGGG